MMTARGQCDVTNHLFCPSLSRITLLASHKWKFHIHTLEELKERLNMVISGIEYSTAALHNRPTVQPRKSPIRNALLTLPYIHPAHYMPYPSREIAGSAYVLIGIACPLCWGPVRYGGTLLRSPVIVGDHPVDVSQCVVGECLGEGDRVNVEVHMHAVFDLWQMVSPMRRIYPVLYHSLFRLRESK